MHPNHPAARNQVPHLMIPAHQIPSWRVSQAFENGVAHKFLLTTWGGLGDQACAEPVLRFALKAFPKCEISLATDCPELFQHLKFKEVMGYQHLCENQNEILPKYTLFNTIVPPANLTWEFFSHCLVHAVDFASMCSFRLALPNADKELKIQSSISKEIIEATFGIDFKRDVIVHAGRHWPSKTFPKPWWDDVLTEILAAGYRPVLIGKDADDNRGTVDVATVGCLDLRNETSLDQMIAILINAQCLITNDSSPMHIAAAGKAFIGFVASCKHPDYIMHWREGQWAWRMKNLGLDGIWNHIDHSPNQEVEVKVDILPDGLMEKILPAPTVVADYVKQSMEAF